MRYGTAALLFGTSLLAACSSSDDNPCQQGEAFEGCWLTEDCEQLLEPDGQPAPRWARARYMFGPNGDLTSTASVYDNADCAGESSLTVEGMGREDIPKAEYEVLGQEWAGNGLLAWRVHWYWPLYEASPLNRTGLVHQDNNRLCLPSWLHLGGNNFGYSGSGGSEIDYRYGHCLTRD